MHPVYRTPRLQPIEAEVLGMIDELRDQLRNYVNLEPRRWYGTLRRMSFARAVQGSNSIEGYDASLDDVIAAVDDEPTLTADEETRLALAGYRDAMTYVLQIAQDSTAGVDTGLLKSLHFMMLKHRLDKDPGRWRPGEIYVVRESTGEQTYVGPPFDQVPDLIDATIAELEDSGAHVLARAAMAHLNLVMVHPFRDGNGRMARALQTLVLAREEIRAPVFSSIEEYLGRNTESYYEVLGEVGRGHWHPENDARPWLRYCLRAHYHQARTQLRRVQETERLYDVCTPLSCGTSSARGAQAYPIRPRAQGEKRPVRDGNWSAQPHPGLTLSAPAPRRSPEPACPRRDGRSPHTHGRRGSGCRRRAPSPRRSPAPGVSARGRSG
jgi:Fic family protein